MQMVEYNFVVLLTLIDTFLRKRNRNITFADSHKQKYISIRFLDTLNLL